MISTLRPNRPRPPARLSRTRAPARLSVLSLIVIVCLCTPTGAIAGEVGTGSTGAALVAAPGEASGTSEPTATPEPTLAPDPATAPAPTLAPEPAAQSEPTATPEPTLEPPSAPTEPPTDRVAADPPSADAAASDADQTPDATPSPRMSTPDNSAEPGPAVEPGSAPVPLDSYVVTFDHQASADARAAALAVAGAELVEAIPALDMLVVALPAADAVERVGWLRAAPSVRRVERDIERSTDAQPSDPRYDDQWSLPRIGWDVARQRLDPTGRTVVAILDTGVDPRHPDLNAHLLPGVSFVEGIAPDTDANGHGTWMAGIVAAETDNDRGISGVAWSGVDILPVTVLGPDGTGRDSDIVQGLVRATDAGADVVLMAFSAPGYSSALQAAVDYAWAHDVVVIAATGNEGSQAPTYPAGDRGVIGVASTDRDDLLAPGSNSGPAAFIAAPGVDILTTDAGGGLEAISGTSAAAAEVAGAAAVLRAADHAASNGTIVGRLARSAARADTPEHTGNGRLDLGRAAADRDTTPVTPRGTAGRADGGPFIGPYVAAATRTWTGGGGDNNWTTAANWGGTAPVAGDDLVFPGGAARLTNTNNYAAGTSFVSITISGTGYTLSGNSIALGAAGVAATAVAATNTISLPLVVAATATVNVSDAASTLTLSGVQSGAGGRTKTGSGTLILSATNTYTGATSVTAGIVRVQSNAALGTAAGTTSVASGAAVEIDGSGLAIAEPISSLSGTGVGGVGALRNVANANTWSGAITLGAASTLTSSAGTLTVSGAIATAGFNLTVAGSGNGTKTTSAISGTGSLTQTASGTLLLSVANTYTGATTVSAGTLRLGIANGVGASSALTVDTGATFDLNGVSDTVASLAGAGTVTSGVAGAVTLTAGGSNASTTFSGLLAAGSGTLALTKTGTGTLTLSAANTYTGATTVSAGIVRVQSAAALGTTAGTTSIATGAAIEIDGSGLTIAEPIASLIGTGVGGAGALRNVANANTWSGAITLGGASTVTSTAGTMTLSGGVGGNTRPLTLDGAGDTLISGVIGTTSGTLTKTGAGTLTLSGTNTYTGATTVSAGTIRVQSDAALGTTGGTTSIATGAAIEIDGSGLTIAEPISIIGTGVGGAGALRNLANANTWSGAMTLGSAAGAMVTSSAGTMTLAGGVGGNNRPLTVDGAGDTLISGVIGTINGTLTKTGSGTLILSATNTYAGATTISAGIVRLGIANGVGSSSALTVDAGATFDHNGFSDTVASIAGAGTLTTGLSGAVTLTAGGSNATTTFSGVIAAGSGTLALTKTGNGTLTLSGMNTYTGATTISAGTLSIAADAGLGTPPSSPTPGHLSIGAATLATTATFTLDSDRGVALTGAATVSTAAATTLTEGGVVAGAGTLTKTGTGTLTLSAANTYTGATTVSAGIVRVQSAAALGTTAGTTSIATGAAIEIDGSGLTIAEPIASLIGTGVGGAGALRNVANANTWSGTLALGAGGATVTSAAGTMTLSGAISGATRPLTVDGSGDTTIGGVIGTTSGTLTKTGTGTLTLSGTNTYTGATTVSAGIVRVQSAAALGTTAGTTSVASGAAIEIDGSGLTIAEPIASLIGTGVGGAGALRNVANANTWSGAITLGGASTVTSTAGTMTLSGALATAGFGLTIDGAGNVTKTTSAISGAGTLTKTGAGTLTLSAANTYTGATTINAGTISIAADAGLGTAPASATAGHLAISGGTLRATASLTLNANRGIALNAAGATFDVATAATMAYAGVATGAGSLTKTSAGTLSLTGGSVTTDDVTISGGTINGPATFAVSGDWTNDASTTAYSGGTGTVSLGGSGGQSVGGSFATTFNGLTISDAAGVTLGGNVNVNGVLALNTGIVATGANTLSLGPSGSVSRTAGHVNGNLRKPVAIGSPSLTFEIGDASSYAPVSVTFAGVSSPGTLTASTTAGDQPQLASSTFDTSLMANRYWTLTGNGLTFASYSGTFTFVPGDVDSGADPNDFVVERYSGGSWTPLVAGTRTATSTQATGITGFGDFSAGELAQSALDHFVVTAPGAATAGSPLSTTVTAVDAVGNVVTRYTGTIAFSSTDTYAAFSPASYPFLAADHGTRTFSNGATLNAAGTQTIGVTGSSKSGTSGSIVVSPGAFARLLVLVPGETAVAGSPTGRTGTPATQTANTPFSVTVRATDAQWNAVSATDVVAITSSDAAAVLPPNAALVGGVQTFSVNLQTGGSTTVTATDVTDGTKTANTSSAIPVTNSAPVTNPDSYSMVQDRTLVVAAAGVLTNDSDPENQPLSVATPRPVSGPSHGALTLNADGSFTYTPDAGYIGPDAFTYRATDGYMTSADTTVTIDVTSTAYRSSSGWPTSFSSSRYLDLTFPAYVAAGSTVSGATFTHTYRSETAGDTTCYYFEVYEGASVLATHGSTSSPVSCTGTTWATDVVALPEIDSVAKANDLRVRLYVQNSGGGYSLHRLVTVGVDYSLR